MEISAPRSYRWPNGQLVFLLKLSQDHDNLDVFLGDHVINGVPRTVVAIQKSVHDAPWKAGEEIGLVIAQ